MTVVCERGVDLIDPRSSSTVSLERNITDESSFVARQQDHVYVLEQVRRVSPWNTATEERR